MGEQNLFLQAIALTKKTAMSSMVLKPKLLLDCSLSMGIKSWRRERCQDNSAWGFSGSNSACCCCLQEKRAHFLMIHTIALLSAVYLDLEFISSRAKLCKAQAENRLHVGKAHFQYAICINAWLCDTSFVSVPLLVSNRYANRDSHLQDERKTCKPEGLLFPCCNVTLCCLLHLSQTQGWV